MLYDDFNKLNIYLIVTVYVGFPLLSPGVKAKFGGAEGSLRLYGYAAHRIGQCYFE
ncbi:uncharacterized protein PHALS_04629 [Plasmopara halstedii]|uniref:Uncharacterized protein n=1 Tax=Plasmopara halstedii TaxID=4781 RepID=A0A0P1A9Z1_PLAHL|nr:uncharacterized protein PHALS_04629 [Plasmopara halstedii]CEG37182.1 hypothetical protein PHALS_04629 [Plasmopara halstedii]|eukprot:XP_024573551.1 hypothetical protein PHALS_04629 [Plasmopara halstedii]